MSGQLINIQEASLASGKSPQTIRRLIKSKKIKFKRKRTPQGFNYHINRDSLLEHFKLAPRVNPNTLEVKRELPPYTQEEGYSDYQDDYFEHPQDEINENIRENNKEGATSDYSNLEVFEVNNSQVENLIEQKNCEINKDLKLNTNDQPNNKEESKNFYKIPASYFNQPQQNYRDEVVDTLKFTIEELLAQRKKEMEESFSLIRLFQKRIMGLEAQISNLIEAPKQEEQVKWWQFWK